ncbi:E3 ubiquitin-protein ligase NEURL3-like [Labrus mixtus]|uniref:E3 ubiquitin-protein ligase NEURL3-like n=1 Tax=Labrus mixtus TaxID=508554 RepID=UPI0029BFD4D7|nr:E3 ubiquitin-protein ligase NEURL3-like [Labrus mixtus]
MKHRDGSKPFLKTKKDTDCFLKMMKENINDNSENESETSHKCGWSCLGPLTFHSQTVGDKVRLSHGYRTAERTRDTFKNGLVFSSRAIKPMEKIRLRVEKDVLNWHGGMRVGFTNVPPSSRSLPLPTMAIPNLTETPGHWAAPVHESFCNQGSEVEFWFTTGGSVYVTGQNNSKQKLINGVDLCLPLWAMIDIYGNTCSLSLLGSKKVTWSMTRTSCPATELPTSSVINKNYKINTDIMGHNGNNDETISFLEVEDQEDDCVVCLGKRARVTLPCGHRCLCIHCSPRYLQQFGSCPLCRHDIRAPSEEKRRWHDAGAQIHQSTSYTE